MRIIDLQRRLREVGRIRIGEQVPSSNGKTRPVKLEHFRLTSRDRTVIDAAAQIYGGTAQPWAAPNGQQWEVKTTVDQMPVIIPPGDMAFTQAYEQWTAGGCKVRCDGQFDHIADTDCHCDPDNRACDIHSRLSVILPDLPGLGVWRLDTQGYYAAVELAGIVDLCASYSGRGVMLPARLRLEQRTVKRPKANGSGVETRNFAVPVLDIDVHPMTLAAGHADIEFGSVPAPALPPALTPVPPHGSPVPSIADQLAHAAEPVERAKRSNAQAALPATGLPPRTAQDAAGPAVSANGPVCARCGGSLAGCAVKVEKGSKVHKDGCPTRGSAPDEPSETDTGVQNQGLLEPGAEDAQPALPAATASSNPDDDPDHVVTDIEMLKLAGKVFGPARELVGRGQRSKVIDGCRHALTFLITDGRTASHKDLTLDEKRKLWVTLRQLQDGFLTFEVEVADGAPTAFLVVHGEDIREVAFADLHVEAAA